MREIQAMDDELFVYTHCEDAWLEVSVSQFEFYMHDEKFKACKDKWGKVFEKMGLKLIFVCGWMPTEEKLVKLSEENNLILNI